MILLAFCHSEALIAQICESDSKKNRPEAAGAKYDVFWGVGDDKRGKLPSPNPKSCRIQISWVLGRRMRKFKIS